MLNALCAFECRKVSAETEVLSKEELCERARVAKEQEEKKAKWLARQEEIKREEAVLNSVTSPAFFSLPFLEPLLK